MNPTASAAEQDNILAYYTNTEELLNLFKSLVAATALTNASSSFTASAVWASRRCCECFACTARACKFPSRSPRAMRRNPRSMCWRVGRRI